MGEVEVLEVAVKGEDDPVWFPVVEIEVSDDESHRKKTKNKKKLQYLKYIKENNFKEIKITNF
jgi:hypothetical protein